MTTNARTRGNGEPLMDWQTATLRLTSFPIPSVKLDEASWWSEVVQKPSEAKLQKLSLYRETSAFENGKLILEVQPGRIDWLYRGPEMNTENLESLPLTGPFPSSLEVFSKLMLRWLSIKSYPPTKRIAFGAVLFQPIETVKSGYQRIIPFLPSVKLDPEGSSDFMFQINRARASKTGITGLKVNRLSKWSVGSMKLVAIESTMLEDVAFHEQVFCSLELDINTAQEFKGELPQDRLSKIYTELTSLGKEIAEKGDIP